MENNLNLEKVKKIIEQSGLKFESNEDLITTFWRLENRVSLKIITFLDDSKKWIINSTFIGNIKENPRREELILKLLRRNRIIIGVKISIDNNFNIYCGFDVHKEEINPTSLKIRYIQLTHLASKLIALIKN